MEEISAAFGDVLVEPKKIYDDVKGYHKITANNEKPGPTVDRAENV